VEMLDLLSRLVEKSLVVAEEEGGEARYRMLETMRQYAREKLLDAGESERLRDQHLAHFLKLAEDAEPHLSGPAQATWFARLERDYANLRAALEWSLQEPDASLGLRLGSALVMLWIVRGPLTRISAGRSPCAVTARVERKGAGRSSDGQVAVRAKSGHPRRSGQQCHRHDLREPELGHGG
jgi:predicted ATPase